jgi:hypothetical protein
MGNCTALIRLKDGTVISLKLPYYSVAWTIIEADGKKIVVGVIKKLANEESGWASLRRGRDATKIKDWETTSAIDDGAPGLGAARGYDRVTVTLNKDGDAEAVGSDESPWHGMEDAYKGGHSMEGVDTLGLDKLEKVT